MSGRYQRVPLGSKPERPRHEIFTGDAAVNSEQRAWEKLARLDASRDLSRFIERAKRGDFRGE